MTADAMIARSRRRFHVVLWTLCCLLISQWSLAAHACSAITRAGHVQAQAQIEAEIAAGARAESGHDCHGAESFTADEFPADGAAICMKYCADESSATGGVLTVAAAAMAPPSVIRTLVVDSPVPVHWEQAPAGADATAPPLSILYGVFLN